MVEERKREYADITIKVKLKKLDILNPLFR